MAKHTKPAKHPTRATLSSEQYNTLIRLSQRVDLMRLDFQAQLAAAMQQRDAYYAGIAAQYHLPVRFATLNAIDETLTIDVT